MAQLVMATRQFAGKLDPVWLSLLAGFVLLGAFTSLLLQHGRLYSFCKIFGSDEHSSLQYLALSSYAAP